MGGGGKVGSRIKILIADDMIETRSNIRRMLSSQDGLEIVGEAGTGEETLEQVKKLQPHLVLMDINMPGLDGLKATEQLAKEKPEVAVVIMSIQAENEYFRRAMKAGAKDFLTKPFSTSELVDTLHSVFTKWVKDRPEFAAGTGRRARFLTLFSTKGGVGKTTLAVNMAMDTASRGLRTLLWDCSLQFGDVAITLNQKLARNLATLIEKPDFDLDDLRKQITTHPAGLDLLLAPPEPALADKVTAAHLNRVFELLSDQYDFVFVDTAPHIGEQELAIFDRTDMLFLVATLEISALKNTKLCLKAFTDLKMELDKIKLLLNREMANVGISPADIEKGLAIPLFATVPADAETAQRSLNHGEALMLKFPESTLARSLHATVDRILSAYGQTVEENAPTGFFLKLKKLISS